METGKKVANVLIGILICILTIGVTFCLLTKSVIKKDIINGLVKNEMIKSIDTGETDEIKKLVDNKEIDKVINGLIDDSINSIEKDKYKVSDDTFDDLKDYLKENEDLIEDIAGEDVDLDEMLDSDEFNELKEEMNKSFSELSKLSKRERKLVILFSKLPVVNSLLESLVFL